MTCSKVTDVDPILLQGLLDANRRDIDAMAQEAARAQARGLEDARARAEAHRLRRLAEQQQVGEEMAARRFVDEQERQMRNAKAGAVRFLFHIKSLLCFVYWSFQSGVKLLYFIL